MNDSSPTFTPPEHCWRSIGIWGDASCPKLREEIHCHNCPVYIQSGRHQLEQPSSEGYRKQWAEILSHPKEVQPTGVTSVAIFRFGGHILALPTAVFKRILEPRPIHPIPHRTNNVLLGLVPVLGELHLAFSLPQLIGLKIDAPFSGRARSLPRMAQIEKEGDRWVFPVDEVLALHELTPESTLAVPGDPDDPATTYLTAMFEFDGQIAHCIDDGLLFASLKRSLQ